MSLPFCTLQEFIEARDSGGLFFPELEARIKEMDLRKLASVLAKNFWGRFFSVKRWLKEVERLCDAKIKLEISLSPHLPYMRESGVLALSGKDFFKPEFLFFSIAHESAHFLLMCDGDYKILKAFDREYPPNAPDRVLRAPIEYCANLITLKILERCLPYVKTEKHKTGTFQYMQYLQNAINKNKRRSHYEKT